jgi:hypothetical protein
MQLYRVKLNEGHTAKPDQIAGDYLGGYANIDPMLYTHMEAVKKARMFGGSIEKFGRDYTIDKLKVIQIPKVQLSQALINELKNREVFIDTDNMLEEVMYSSDVFETILGEQYEYFEKQTLIRVGKEHQVLVDELMVLDEICKDSQYVMFTTI